MVSVVPFSAIKKNSKNEVGGKGLALGEMSQASIPVPPGYVVTAEVFEHFLEENDIGNEISALLSELDYQNSSHLEFISKKIQSLISSKELGTVVLAEIISAIQELQNSGDCYFAVRSSATSEDGVDHSWAGQLDTYLNVPPEKVGEKIQDCWASLFNPRALFYRAEKGLIQTRISVAVVIQSMIEAECAGVAFSVDPMNTDNNRIVIEGTYGLGEAVVSGEVTPDSFSVDKKSCTILSSSVAKKEKGLFRNGTEGNEWRSIEKQKQEIPILSDNEIHELSHLVVRIENYYDFPCDIEWAYAKGTFFILQARPITTLTRDQEKQKNKVSELYKEQISLTEWFDRIGHSQTNILRDEDNEKRERLKILKSLIGLPFDEPRKFSARDVAQESPEFLQYVQEHANERCAMRLVPRETGLPKFRMRGQTVSDVVKKWFPQQAIDPDKYRVEFMPHTEVNIWSTIFIVNENGIFGEMVAGGHHELTQGFYEGEGLITFSYDFHTWSTSPKNIDAEEYLRSMAQYIYLPELDVQSSLTKELGSTFINNYLIGYFETVHSEFGTWFIDYSPALGNIYAHYAPKLEKPHGDVTGVSGCSGLVAGRVRIVEDPRDVSLESNEILVCNMTSPHYILLMQQACGIITNRGGVLSHAGIIARELGKPTILATGNATEVLQNGDMIELDADKGIVTILVKGS